MRVSGLHIGEDTLRRILPEIRKTATDDEAVDLIFRLSKKDVLRHRQIAVSDSKTTKKIKKSIDASEADVELFRSLLHNYRVMMNHQRIARIDMGSSEYTLLKEVCMLAEEFVVLFGIKNKSMGFTEFIRRGIIYMNKKYSLGKFKYYKNSIFEDYENVMVVNEDFNKKGTLVMYGLWKNLMAEYTDGKTFEVDREDDLVHFVFARQEADELGADYATYLKAQFETLYAMFKALPEYGALYGIKAKSRYRKYVISVIGTDEAIKDTRLKKNMTDAQLRYEKLRNKRGI